MSGWYAGGERAVEIVSERRLSGTPRAFARRVPVRAGFSHPRDAREEFEARALLCSDLEADPSRIISWFVRRWQMGSTSQEVRQRLGFETQRRWSEMAIRRVAPGLLALFSPVALFAHQRKVRMPETVRQAAWWYDKEHPAFSAMLWRW